MFIGIYRVFTRKSKCRDFRIAGFTCLSAFSINSVGFAIYGFCGESLSPKSVHNTIQIMWVSNIKLTGKPFNVLIFQQFQLISSEFARISL